MKKLLAVPKAVLDARVKAAKEASPRAGNPKAAGEKATEGKARMMAHARPLLALLVLITTVITMADAPTQPTARTPNSNQSEEVKSLRERRSLLQKDISAADEDQKFWNGIEYEGLAITAIVIGGLAGLSSWGARSYPPLAISRASPLRSDLEHVDEGIRELLDSISNGEIARAQADAGKANEAAGKANESAGKANERAATAEEEANLNLRKDLENAVSESQKKQTELEREQQKYGSRAERSCGGTR